MVSCYFGLQIHIPLCRTAAGQHAFTFRGQKLWNSLPDEFQSITNFDVFKAKIKQHFLRAFLEKISFRYLTLKIKLKSLLEEINKVSTTTTNSWIVIYWVDSFIQPLNNQAMGE